MRYHLCLSLDLVVHARSKPDHIGRNMQISYRITSSFYRRLGLHLYVAVRVDKSSVAREEACESCPYLQCVNGDFHLRRARFGLDPADFSTPAHAHLTPSFLPSMSHPRT